MDGFVILRGGLLSHDVLLRWKYAGQGCFERLFYMSGIYLPREEERRGCTVSSHGV